MVFVSDVVEVERGGEDRQDSTKHRLSGPRAPIGPVEVSLTSHEYKIIDMSNTTNAFHICLS